MKKIVFLALLISVSFFSKASVIPLHHPVPASSIMVALPGSHQFISLADMSTMTPAIYYQLTGKKLPINDRVKLMLLKRQAKRMILPDGTLNQERLNKQAGFFSRHQWNWGGFALGFLIIVGPLIALFFHDEYKWDRFWTAMDVNGILISILSVIVATSGV